MRERVEYVFMILSGVIGSLLGGHDGVITLLLYVMVLDFVLGVSIAYRDKDLSSGRMTKGFYKRAGVFVVIMMAVQLSIFFNLEFIRTSTILYYISVEGLSILENVNKLEVPVPNFLGKFLERLREENNSHEEGNSDER